MTEFLRQISDIPKTIERYRSFIFSEDDPADVGSLLLPGKVEELVRETRTPLKRGTIQIGDTPEQPYYVVPPKGFNATDIKGVEYEMDVMYFVNKLGIKRAALDFILTDEQAQEVEERVKTELIRLGKFSKNVDVSVTD